jgi:glycosyltransferase involved in cell wall biosynthesis
LKKVYLFHKGIQHADQTCLALQESNQLHKFSTSRFFIKNRYPYKILNLFPDKSYIKKRLFTRYNKNLNVKNIKLFGLFSWINLILKFFSLGNAFNKYEYEYFSKKMIKDIEKDIKNIDIIWGFNNYSYDVFKKFKKTKVIKVLDLTIAFILDAEKRFSKKNDIYQLSKVERDKQILEVKLADKIVVGSKFTRQSLINYKIPSSKIKIIPYGFDETLFKKENLKKRTLKKNQTLKILFVGTINKRKGADHLINAIKKFNKSEVKLLMIGENELDIDINELPNNIEIKPFMQKKEFLKYFYKSQLFCFPTLYEGSALVIYEAVGSGLPILTTTDSGHDVKKFGDIKIKSGSTKSIVSAINKILKKPSEIEKMSKKSIDLYKVYNWTRYRKQISKFLDKIKK